MKKYLILITVVMLVCSIVGLVYAAKQLKQSQVTIWDKDGDGVVDEVECYWTIGTSDDATMFKNLRKRYTANTNYFGSGNDLQYLKDLTVIQAVTAIKNNVKADEGI